MGLEDVLEFRGVSLCLCSKRFQNLLHRAVLNVSGVFNQLVISSHQKHAVCVCVCARTYNFTVCVCGCVCMECVSSLLMADPNIKYTICILHDVVLAIQMLYVWHLAKSP